MISFPFLSHIAGKQVVSTVLRHLLEKEGPPMSLKSKTRVPEHMWARGSGEGTVIIQDNELLCGVLEVSQYGKSKYGLVHCAYNLYGPHASGKLLSALSRLFTTFIQSNRGFSCGMQYFLFSFLKAGRISPCLFSCDLGSKT
jgi:DNA-directed RNA polymerase I subunit RPA1